MNQSRLQSLVGGTPDDASVAKTPRCFATQHRLRVALHHSLVRRSFSEGGATPPRQRRSAFTLIELLVVMLIIVVLAGIVLKAVRVLDERGKIQQAKADLALLNTALERYRVDHGKYPFYPQENIPVLFRGVSGFAGIQHYDDAILWAYLDEGCTFRQDRRSYINNWPKSRLSSVVGATVQFKSYLDPWGNAYMYRAYGDAIAPNSFDTGGGRGGRMANADMGGIRIQLWSRGSDGTTGQYGPQGDDISVGDTQN